MPQLPKSMLLPHKALKKNQEYYSARARIAIRPEDTITITHKTSAHNSIMSTLVDVNPEHIHTDEYQHKKLFFQKIESLCTQDGYTINAAQMFCKDENDKIYGSQGLLTRTDFAPLLEKFSHTSIPLNESTTPYMFLFSFIGDAYNSVTKDNIKNKTIAPIYMMDDRHLCDLKNAGIADNTIQTMGADFMRLAACSDHDYIHGMTLEHREGLPYELDSNYDRRFYGIALEKHALALHAKVFQELFKDCPKRKEHYLSYVHNSLTHILDIQKHLSTNATTPQDMQRNTDIITHLAEIHAHRIFRVVSPDDLDLAVSATPDAPSINDLLNAIDIHVPPLKLDKDSGYTQDMLNKEKLLLNLSIIDTKALCLRPGIYRDIHGLNTVDAYYNPQNHVQQHSLTEIMGDFYQSYRGTPPDTIQKRKSLQPQ